MRPIPILQIGLGTVGQALYRQLHRHPGFSMTSLVVREPHKERPGLEGPVLSAPEALEKLSDPGIPVILEAIDDPEAALAYARRALDAGKTYISANKRMLAFHLPALQRLARHRGGQLLFEAAAGGAIPVLRTLRDHLWGQEIRQVRAVINGSCNYILTRMEEDALDLPEALNEARRRGFAESDPTLDIEGFDAQYKTVLLAWEAFGEHLPPAEICRQGIHTLSYQDVKEARRAGARIRLVSTLQREPQGILARVLPEWVWPEDPLYHVRLQTNAVEVCGEPFGTLLLQGPGAGGPPTASAMIADLEDWCRGFTFREARSRLAGMDGVSPISGKQATRQLRIAD